jgi:drug/metabolite transporter (DMT)-like permease
MTAVILSLLSAVLYGVGDFWGALASRRSHILQVLPAILISGTLTVVVLIPWLGANFSPLAIRYGVASGFFGAAGFFIFYRALAIGPMGIASAIIAIVSTTIMYIVDVLKGTHVSTLGIVGAVLAMASIVLVSKSTEDATHPVTAKMVQTAVLAGVVVAGFFMLLAYAPSDSGVATFTCTRLTQLVLIGSSAFLLRNKIERGAKPSLKMSVGAGVADALGAVAFIFANHTGSLAFVAVISNLYPAVTLIIAHFVIHERVERHQYVGMAGAIASVALLTLA